MQAATAGSSDRADSISSFLTDEQRAALDAALAAKAAENAAAAKSQHKSSGAVGDRKSRNKGLGTAKKHGGGGKFTWGSILTNGDQAEKVLDRKDPNYDSDEERVVVMTQQDWLKAEIQSYKQEVVSIVEEYFASGDIGEVAASLEDLGAADFMHYFVKRLIILALDRKDREREMTSVLLSSLYAEVIPPEQVRKGFTSVVESVDDTALDVPGAAELLALFIARAIVDDVLPPAFAAKIPDASSHSAALKARVEAQLAANHSAEKILRCWGAGAGLVYQDTKDSIQDLLTEFTSSFDADEASRCLRALAVPFFHHELVKQAVHKAMTATPAQREALLGLLARLSRTGEVSQSQLAKGLSRVSDNLKDLCLDNPSANEQWEEVLQAIREAKLLDGDSALSLPSSSTMATDGGASINGSVAQAAAGGHSLAAFKAAAAASIREYFDSSDAAEVARRLAELDDPGLLHILVKQAIVLALDRKDAERELVSNLLCHLASAPAPLPPSGASGAAAAGPLLSRDQLAMGFTRLLSATDDLVLDCPDAVRLLSLFLGRAIVDEILPPSFLTQVLLGLRAESLGVAVVRATGALLSARHGAERVTQCWHGGALSLDQVKDRIRTALREYVASRDIAETSRCISELGMPFYHHGVVLEAIELAFEQGAHADALVSLLAALAATGVINQTQMTKGFARVKGRLDEEALDFGPHARDVYGSIVQKATAGGWLVLDVEA